MTDRRCRFGPRPRSRWSTPCRPASRRVGRRSMAVRRRRSPRARDAGRGRRAGAREDGACCAPRRPVPRSCPWALSAEDEQRILDARARKTNWGPMRLAALTGRHRSTVWKVLKRHGVSRRRRGQRARRSRRFEWSQPGALLHIDAYSRRSSTRPGHWAHRRARRDERTRGLGTTVVIAVQDDHTRLVYCELHSAENAANVSATLRRARGVDARAGLRPASRRS